MGKHASDRERYHIRVLASRGLSQKAIAEEVGWS